MNIKELSIDELREEYKQVIEAIADLVSIKDELQEAYYVQQLGSLLDDKRKVRNELLRRA